MREAPSLVNIQILLEDGANIKAWDPIGIENFKNIHPEDINYCNSIEETLEHAEICFIFTEWDEIKKINPEIFNMLIKTPIVLDERNCFDIEVIKAFSVEYNSIGR